MLTKTEKVSRIEVLEDCSLLLHKETAILEDGTEITRFIRPSLLKPGDIVTKEDEKVQAISGTVWTKAVIDDYKAEQAKKIK